MGKERNSSEQAEELGGKNGGGGRCRKGTNRIALGDGLQLDLLQTGCLLHVIGDAASDTQANGGGGLCIIAMGIERPWPIYEGISPNHKNIQV